jgi:hypothetical protein
MAGVNKFVNVYVTSNCEDNYYIIYLLLKIVFLQHVSNFIRLQVMRENRKIIQVEKK